jgi:hypothetical protein
MTRLLCLLLVVAASDAAAFAPAPFPKPARPQDRAGAVAKALASMSGSWVQISVRYGGEELFDPPATGHTMRFDGTEVTEYTGSGRQVLVGAVRVVGVAGGVIRIDLPRNVIAGGRVWSVTVKAIARVRQGRMQVAYFDRPDAAGGGRPEAFESTAANRVALITLVPRP